MISIYLDVCCLNRPFDDQSQERVRLEAEAIKSITRRMDNNKLIGVGSTAVLTEIDNNRDQERKAQLHKTASAVKKFIKVEEKQNQRAIELQGMGFHFLMRCTSPVPKKRAWTFFSQLMTAFCAWHLVWVNKSLSGLQTQSTGLWR